MEEYVNNPKIGNRATPKHVLPERSVKNEAKRDKDIEVLKV